MQSNLQISPLTDLSRDEEPFGEIGELESASLLGQGWSRICRALPLDAGAAAETFIQTQGLSRECLSVAAWSQVIGCFGGGDEPIRIVSLSDPSLKRAVLSGFCPSVESDPILVDWLRSVDQLIWQSPRAAESLPHTDCSSPGGHNQLKGVSSVVAISDSDQQFLPGQVLSLLQTGGESILVEVTGSLRTGLSITYLPYRFSKDFITVLLDCLAHVFVQLVSNGSARFSALSLVAAELRLPTGSDLSALPATILLPCAHEMIEQQSQRTPDRIAAVCHGKTITYVELNARSNQIANYLRCKGCGPEVLVAVHMGRSLDLLIAILAVLKAGAAFLPLDELLPAARIQAVMEDSAASFVITSTGLAGRFNSATCQILRLDADQPWWNLQPTETPTVRVAPENLAYVIYTSGSTGKPKGVMIEHRNLTSFIQALDKVFGCEPGVWLAIASISFDISIIELLWTLARGFQVVLHAGDGGIPLMLGPGSVPEQMLQYGVTHLAGTPTLMRMLAGSVLAKAAFSNLKICFVGGEAFPSNLTSPLLDLVSNGSVINGYGPTEITVAATYHRIHCAAPIVPIGKALSNTRLYVVDRWQRALPPLATGELMIGGLGVGRGYLNRPELTGTRFVSNGHDKNDKQLLYRSGDLVYADLCGDLHFIDRLDSQVKIRGYRIELSEIEAILLGHPEILQAAVIVREDASHGKSLVAFYRPRGKAAIPPAVLRSFMKALLPSYMVPAVIRPLEHFPVTPNGKLDRVALTTVPVKNLPNSGESARARGAHQASENLGPSSAGPKPAIEADLCKWFAELLELPFVGPLDDFFELGGQSIIAAQLISRIAARLEVNLRLSVLIEARTARALTGKILDAKERNGNSWSPVVAIRQGGSKPPLFIIAGLGGNVVNFEFVAGNIIDRPVYGVETYGLDARGETLPSVETMARTYLEEIRRVQPNGPYYLAGYSFGGTLAFEMAQQLRSVGVQVGLVGLIDTVEWHYSMRVISELSLWDSWNLHYGQTLRQIVLGPDRRKTLVKRWQTFREHRRITLPQPADRKSEPNGESSPERRNYYAARNYHPQPYSGEVHLFRCPEKSLRRGYDPTLGWGRLCQSLKITEIDGEHEQITAEPFAGSLSQALQGSLDSVEPCSVSALTGLQTALNAC